jgi:hypothetical protein
MSQQDTLSRFDTLLAEAETIAQRLDDHFHLFAKLSCAAQSHTYLAPPLKRLAALHQEFSANSHTLDQRYQRYVSSPEKEKAAMTYSSQNIPLVERQIIIMKTLLENIPRAQSLITDQTAEPPATRMY